MKLCNCFFVMLAMTALAVMPALSFSATSKELENQQPKSCLDSLNNYFTNEVPVEQLRIYLNTQFEVTAYRLLASMLAQREEQQRDFREGKRDQKAIATYSSHVKEHVAAMEKELGDDPQFIEAKKSFANDPLSISSLAQLAPFIERRILKHSNIYDKGAYSANFRLDVADFKMLNFLAYVEENRRKPLPRTTFVNHIENYEQGFLDDMEQNVNLVIVERYSIQEAQQAIKSFWRELKIPPACAGEDSLYSFMQKNDEVSQMLFNSMLKRDDMMISREERSHTYVFHTGRTSPNRWAEDADVYEGADGQDGIISEAD